MVQFQIRITTPPSGDVRLEVEILPREDATEFERGLARSFEELFEAVSQHVADETGVLFTLSRIGGGDDT